MMAILERLLISLTQCGRVILIGTALILAVARWYTRRNPRLIKAHVPLWRDMWEEWIERRSTAHERQTNLSVLRNKTALIIAPEDKSTRVLMWQLDSLGCKVLAARNGTQGLKKAEKHQPHFFVIDSLLSDVSASYIYNSLNRTDAPTLFIGVMRTQWDELHGLGPNVACFAKPYDPEEALAQVGYMFRRKVEVC